MAKRYVSIDFLRGLAIWMLIFLHTMMRWINQSEIEATIGTQELFVVFIFIGAVFFGGWCGFFLLVSSIGNMISMASSVEHGQSWKQLAFRQVLSGVILLVFAYLSEGVIGYHGWLGENISHTSTDWTRYIDELLSRGSIMEAIQAVAWCVIINGVVHAFLCRNQGYIKPVRNMKIYAILAVIVTAITPLVWFGVSALIPGYPGAMNPASLVEWQRGYLGRSDFLWLVSSVFLLPIAGQPEPILPFLAVSFIGSIVGIWLTQKKPDRRFLRKGMIVALVLFLVGLVGTIVVVFTVPGAIGAFFGSFWNLRALDRYAGLWCWFFLCLTGGQLGAVLLVLRLVEFRGRAEIFAKQSVYWRRFGFVAFTIYTFEFVDMVSVWLFNLIPGMNMYSGDLGTFNKWQVWPIILGTFLTWQLILKLWEKRGYVFSLEWIIAKISGKLIPSKRAAPLKALPWWKTPRLDVDNVLLHPEAIQIVQPEEIDHATYADSRLACKVALWGFLFFPLGIAAVIIAREASKVESPNPFLKKAIIIGWILVCAIIAVTILSFFFTLTTLGLGGLI
jgi:preprotein translocase subunit Sss1